MTYLAIAVLFIFVWKLRYPTEEKERKKEKGMLQSRRAGGRMNEEGVSSPKTSCTETVQSTSVDYIHSVEDWRLSSD